jgi:hypothetical protein
MQYHFQITFYQLSINKRKHRHLTTDITEDDYKLEYNTKVYKPEGGGTVEVAVDTDPMFSVIKASKEL